MKGFALPLRKMPRSAPQSLIATEGLIKHWPKIDGRAADYLEHFRGGSLLLARLAQFAGKPSDLYILQGRTRLVFRHIAALWLWRLATSPFDGSPPALERLFIASPVG